MRDKKILSPCTLTNMCTWAIYLTVEGTSRCSKVMFCIDERTCWVLRISICTCCKFEITLIPVAVPTSRTAKATRSPGSVLYKVGTQSYKAYRKELNKKGTLIEAPHRRAWGLLHWVPCVLVAYIDRKQEAFHSLGNQGIQTTSLLYESYNVNATLWIGFNSTWREKSHTSTSI